jgi:hypothetical protein
MITFTVFQTFHALVCEVSAQNLIQLLQLALHQSERRLYWCCERRPNI